MPNDEFTFEEATKPAEFSWEDVAPGRDLRAIKEVPRRDYDYLKPLPPITDAQLAGEVPDVPSVGYAGLAPLGPITASQLAEDKTPWLQRPGINLVAPTKDELGEGGSVPRIPVLGKEGSKLRAATEFAQESQAELSNAVESMATPEAALTYPLFSVPYLGPALASVLGTKIVSGGLGEVITGAELHDPRIAGRGFSKILAGSPLLARAGLPRDLPFRLTDAQRAAAAKNITPRPAPPFEPPVEPAAPVPAPVTPPPAPSPVQLLPAPTAPAPAAVEPVTPAAQPVEAPAPAEPKAAAPVEAAVAKGEAGLFVRQGTRLVQVTPEQASLAMATLREKTGLGASGLPPIDLYDANGNKVGHVSYNGRVWRGDKVIAEAASAEKQAVAPAEATAPEAPKPAPTTAPVAQAQAEVTRVARTEGTRSAKDIKAELVSRLEQAIEGAPTVDPFEGLVIAPEGGGTLQQGRGRSQDISLKAWLDKNEGKSPGIAGRYKVQAFERAGLQKVTIDIPGDGTFTVWNTREALEPLLGRAKRISTDATVPTKVTRRTPAKLTPEELAAMQAEPPAPPTGAAPSPEEHARTSPTTDPFERARAGDDSAFDDLDAQFREIYPEPEEIARPGRSDPNQVHTPTQFADRFNTAFAARDFQTILDTIKATSDVSIWKPFLKDLFAKQANDPIAARKADWFRHVFNGTVPADAIPRTPRPSATPPPPRPAPAPRPSTSTPPPRGAPPPPPPAPPPPRIEVAPITGGGAKSPFQIIEDFSAAIKKSIRVLRLRKNELGTYAPGSTRTAERFAGDLDTAAHELAGHWTDDRYGIGKPWIAPHTRSPYDTELAKFWIHGSVTPTSTLRYRRAEGIAEFIRAYVVNPTAAKAAAPNFSAYFERTLPAEALKAINDFGTDIRRWAGEDPLVRAGLNIRMEPPSLTERLWQGIRGRGFGFEINPLDKLRMWFDDPYHYAVKAFHELRAVRGGAMLPKDNFELLARLLATHDARMSDQFEYGLTPLRPTQTLNARGELVVDRIIDPVTSEPMTLKWLLDPLDKTDKAKMNQDLRDASAFMVAQRTIEKGPQLGRESQISGIGAGIMTDRKAAGELLRRVAQDPPREARLKEAARRYRLWADKNLDMLVEAGRLSPARAREIRADNQQYVDMHRLSIEFETGFRKQRGGKVGTARDVVRRFKGSTLELNNVYSNLLEQTDSIQKEAFRNVAMNAFTDGLRNVRELHGADLKDFDQFGTKVQSANPNTLTIYKNGKAEHWKFDPDIHESLKGLGELGTHAFIDFLALPSKFVRYMITHGPQFILRNTVRDTFERSVVSRNPSKPWDILQGYTGAELSRYEVFGGGQFGNYIIDRHVWNRELKRTMSELRKDPTNIFLWPSKLKHAWEELSAKSEKIGRIAEFRRAFDKARNELGYDDYNAALYAAGEARGLMDFAKAGTVMRSINRLVPFSNARVRGLARATFAAKENPGRFAMRWAMFVLLPTLATLLWNRRDKKTWDEYQQLPAYQKDFFWNFKVGPYWLRIPKPHELGVMAGGVARAIDRALGDKRAMEGWYGSAGNAAMPLNTPVESTGPLKPILDLYFNKDSFQGREIVPAWEKDLKLGLRKGTTHASGAGQGIAGALNKTGLEIDPRQVDYVLQNFGGLGQTLTDVTKRSLGESAWRATGYVTGTPGASARDVQWVFNWARENGQMNATYMNDLSALRKMALDAKTAEERDRLNAQLRQASTYLRNALDKKR